MIYATIRKKKRRKKYERNPARTPPPDTPTTAQHMKLVLAAWAVYEYYYGDGSEAVKRLGEALEGLPTRGD